MSEKMKLIVNGEATEAAAETTVAQLLAQLDLTDRPVAVEVNRELVPKREHAEHVLQAGDEIECVTLVGGG